MRSLPLLGILLLTSFATGQKVKTVLNNGPVGNRYDIVILGDGYQASEEAKFDQDVQKAINKLFSKSSYKAYKNFFNAHSVFRASNESGADHPDRSPPIVKDTAYDASYNTGGTPRCLYIKNTSRAQADSRLAPDVEGRVIVLVNDTRYGGCAGTFSVSYTGSSGAEVQAHEFGHSFGRLADEYDYGRTGSYTGPEPSQANITKDSTGKAKWPLWLGYNGISAFQGAGYYKTGLWRPKSNCLMRALNVPLCEVCDEQIVKQAYVTVNPIENRTPKATKIIVKRGASATFSVSSLVPGANSIIWSVNNKQVATGAAKFTWNTSAYATGSYTVRVTVKDLTTFVRKDPTNLLSNSSTWTVDVRSGTPGTYATYGAGCKGSGKTSQTCLSVNTGGAHSAMTTRAGVTYAIEATATAGGLNVQGFDLHTASRQSGSVNVAIELYTQDAAGKPAQRVRTGTISVGATRGWYQGGFSSPYKMQSGQKFYIAFVTPAQPIDASIVTGTSTPYFHNDGPGNSWNGPFTSYAWAYKIRCETTGSVPALSAAGTPEIGSSFDLNLTAALPNAAAALIFGISNTTWNNLRLPLDLGVIRAPGCKVLASGQVAIKLTANAQGRATSRIQIPTISGLVGAQFYNQFHVFDAGANTLGLASSNAGVGKVGKP